MGTDNPKVSAYVPQAIKDRLKQFREEQNLSESQAVTAILAEYFGMTQVLGRSPEGLAVEGVTLPRMKALEEKVANLTEVIESRFRELEGLVTSSGNASILPVVHPEVLETEPVVDGSSHNLLTVPSEDLLENDEGKQESSLEGEPPKQGINTQESSLPSESPEELPLQADTGHVGEPSSVEESVNLSGGQEISEAIEVSSAESKLSVDHKEITLGENSVTGKDGSSDSEPPKNSEEALPHQSGLPFELKSEPHTEFAPLNSVKLSRRLGKGDQSVKHMKRKHDIEGFTKWIQEKDPDRIAWKHTPKGYVPTGELTDEQKLSLLKWYEENP